MTFHSGARQPSACIEEAKRNGVYKGGQQRLDYRRVIQLHGDGINHRNREGYWLFSNASLSNFGRAAEGLIVIRSIFDVAPTAAFG